MGSGFSLLSQKLWKIKALAGQPSWPLSQPMGCAWARCHPMSPCQPRPHLTFPISPWSDTTGQAQLCQPRGQSTLNLQEHLEADGRPAAGPTLGLLGQLLTPQSSMVTSGAPLGLGISCLVSAVYSGYCLGNCHPPLSLLPLFTAPTLPPGRSQPSCSGRRVGALVRPASHTHPVCRQNPGLHTGLSCRVGAEHTG